MAKAKFERTKPHCNIGYYYILQQFSKKSTVSKEFMAGD